MHYERVGGNLSFLASLILSPIFSTNLRTSPV
jgi:hypothetical protein